MLLCRVFFATCLLLASTGCPTRTAVSTDGGEPRADGTAKSDTTHHTCKQLVAAGTTLLGPTSELNARPAMTHDGTHFAVAWIHGQDFSATSPATVRFTRVDSAGKAETAVGVKVGAAISVVTPALVHGGGEFGLLYRAPSPAIGDATVLARLRADGIPKQKAVVVGGDSRELALARSGVGYAALVVEPVKTTNYRLSFASVDAKGALSSKVIHTGGGYWLSWLSPRAGGYGAAWDHTFARLDAGGGMMHTTTLKSGMSAVYSASAVGYALAYLDLSMGSKENVWFQLLDPQGKPVGPARGVGTPASFGAMISRYIAMVWTGDMHIVVYTQYQSSGASRLVAQLLDAKGAKVGQPVAMPMCSPKQPGVDLAAAWGGGTLSVATMGGYSSTKAARLCVSRIRCVQ
jgi:hypothetical protein